MTVQGGDFVGLFVADLIQTKLQTLLGQTNISFNLSYLPGVRKLCVEKQIVLDSHSFRGHQTISFCQPL